MPVGTHRCSVNDESCPYICVEHAVDDERTARGERHPRTAVSYPYTNQRRAPGFAVYLQLEPAYGA